MDPLHVMIPRPCRNIVNISAFFFFTLVLKLQMVVREAKRTSLKYDIYCTFEVFQDTK